MRNKPRNIIVLIADSLRYDTVYEQGIGMPYVQQNAIAFREARSGGCWTLPATASLFTGLMPHEHGATSQSRLIHKNVPTLAEKMKAAGYSTHQVTANIATTHIFGLDRGFDEVTRIWQQTPAEFKKLMQLLVVIGKPRLREKIIAGNWITRKMDKDLEATKTWLQAMHPQIFDKARQIIQQNEAKGKGSFIFLNLMETHFPYHTAPTFQFEQSGIFGKFQELAWLYHMVNQTFVVKGRQTLSDEALQFLKERQRKAWRVLAPQVNAFCKEMHEDTDNLVVFGADHGENFGDCGWNYHFSNITDAGNKVPLFWMGQEAARQVAIPVSTRHLHNSLARAVGQPLVGPCLLYETERSRPVMQSYWYDNKGNTHHKYKYNQLSFLEGDSRFLLRNGQWYRAPLQGSYDTPDFQPTPGNANPIYDCIQDSEKREELLDIVKDFSRFASTISFTSKKHEER